jgi:hypothetical protein
MSGDVLPRRGEGFFVCMTYSEKLRDPRWQKMRLCIMERDGFECQKCGDKQSTLNVHHLFYQRGKAPWEYDPSHLVTLCETCHGQVGDEVCAMLFGRLMLALELTDATALLMFLLRNGCAEALSLFELTDDPQIAVDAIGDLANRVRKVKARISGSSSAEILAASALDARYNDGWRDKAKESRKGDE